MVDARRAGILIHGCFMVGNPGETKETLARTLKFAKDLRPDTSQFFPIMVYPGTEAYDWAKEQGYLISEDYSDWLTEEGLHNCVVSRPHLTNGELVEFCDQARREFYLTPGYVASKFMQMILHPKEAKRIIKGARNSLKYLLRGSSPESGSSVSVTCPDEPSGRSTTCSP